MEIGLPAESCQEGEVKVWTREAIHRFFTEITD